MSKNENTITQLSITCKCGAINRLTSEYDETSDGTLWDISIRDTTPCSCGRCFGENYKLSLGTCKSCGSALNWNT